MTAGILSQGAVIAEIVSISWRYMADGSNILGAENENHHDVKDIFQCIFLAANVRSLIQISLFLIIIKISPKFVHKGSVYI